MNAWKPTGMTMATTAMPAGKAYASVSTTWARDARDEQRTEQVDVELRGANRVALLVELEAAGSEATAKNEKTCAKRIKKVNCAIVRGQLTARQLTVRKDAAEHGRADDAEFALGEREDRCAKTRDTSARAAARASRVIRRTDDELDGVTERRVEQTCERERATQGRLTREQRGYAPPRASPTRMASSSVA